MPPAADQPDSSPAAEGSEKVDFEATLMFQQKLLDELNEVVLRQQAELDRLRGEVSRLREEVQRAVEIAGSELPPDEKPPHY